MGWVQTDKTVCMEDMDTAYGMKKGIGCWSWRMHIAQEICKTAGAIARKQASVNLMKEMKVDVNSKKIFKKAKQSTRDRKYVKGNGCVRDTIGKLCLGERERVQVWKDHMERVINKENEWDGDVKVDVTRGPVEKVMLEEVEKAMRPMRLCIKETGVSEVAAEHIIATAMARTKVITGIVNRIVTVKDFPPLSFLLFLLYV